MPACPFDIVLQRKRRFVKRQISVAKNLPLTSRAYFLTFICLIVIPGSDESKKYPSDRLGISQEKGKEKMFNTQN